MLRRDGGLAQLGERLLCKQEVSGSIPLISTIPKGLEFFGGPMRGAKIEIKSKRLKFKRFDLTSREVGSCTLKTEQCNEKTTARQQRGAAERLRKFVQLWKAHAEMCAKGNNYN